MIAVDKVQIRRINLLKIEKFLRIIEILNERQRFRFGNLSGQKRNEI